MKLTHSLGKIPKYPVHAHGNLNTFGIVPLTFPLSAVSNALCPLLYQLSLLLVPKLTQVSSSGFKVLRYSLTLLRAHSL